MRTIWIIFLLVQLAWASSPKRELRAAWVVTAYGIDWPPKGMSIEEQKNAFIDYLDYFEQNNFNAVFVQIRPSGDAFYESKFEPWSAYLTGTLGEHPGYDPLKFMIEETHKRNIEFHAWINLFRVSAQKKTTSAQTTFAQKHPDWVMSYNNHLYLDPGIPQVKDYISKVVQDIVKNYDIDGIHIDDYFYPYPVKGEKLSDQNSFNKYGKKYSKIEDWRRDNINQIVKNIQYEIKHFKPYVVFGVSPLPLWKRDANTRNYSSSYDDLYADIITWAKNGWIDYIAPQVYVAVRSNALLDYKYYVNWWVKNKYNCNLYIGHAIFKLGERQYGSSWLASKSQLIQQLNYNRNFDEIEGSIFYSASHLSKKRSHTDSMRHFFEYPSLLPENSMLEGARPATPKKFKVILETDSIKFEWSPVKEKNEAVKPKYYVVYASKDYSLDTENGENILFITKEPTFKVPYHTIDLNAKQYYFSVTAVSRTNKESLPTAALQIIL